MNDSPVQQEQKWKYVPDEKLIATYLADFQKEDTELSHTWEYKIDSIQNPWITESPYGSFASNELLIGAHSGADCQEIIRALYIVKAKAINGLSSKKTCGMDWLFIFPPDTPYEKFLAIIQFLESKSELFSSVSENVLMQHNIQLN